MLSHHLTTQDDIKRAYRKLALLVHPDKCSHLSEQEQQEATSRFQSLSTYYGILSNPDRRKRYDETGSIQEAEALFEKDGDVSWEDFFKQLFDGIVSEKTIEEYKITYQRM